MKDRQMDLDRYNDAAHRLCQSLHAQLSAVGYDRVADRCRSLGRAGFDAYRAETENDCLEFLRSEPAQRTSQLGRIPSEQLPEFLLCLAFQARCALALLNAICHFGVTAGPSIPMVLGQAAAAAHQVKQAWPTRWPLLDFEDPFDEFDPDEEC